MPTLPLPAPPIQPMLAKIAEALPTEPGFLFEPKWDGFRALVFRAGGRTLLQSRDLKPLNRYFPELEQALTAAAGARVGGEDLEPLDFLGFFRDAP
jgi:ATP-dependent DNA ligase